MVVGKDIAAFIDNGAGAGTAFAGYGFQEPVYGHYFRRYVHDAAVKPFIYVYVFAFILREAGQGVGKQGVRVKRRYGMGFRGGASGHGRSPAACTARGAMRPAPKAAMSPTAKDAKDTVKSWVFVYRRMEDLRLWAVSIGDFSVVRS
jgi:hypothetical protein